MASAITNILGGNVLDSVGKIIGLFKISPELAAQHEVELQQIQKEITIAAENAAQKQIDDATENIKAEAAAGSKARPLFMYIIEAIMGFNWIVCPLFKAFGLRSLEPMPLPSNVLLLFGVCLTGYTAFDKVNELMKMPGDSTFQIPGFKIGQKS